MNLVYKLLIMKYLVLFGSLKSREVVRVQIWMAVSELS